MAALSSERLSEVRVLYYERKLSARQIAEHFGVSLDAVYYFMRHHGLMRRSLSEQNTVRFNSKQPSFSLPSVLTSDLERLKVMGVMLYWAEGSKRNPWHIDFANSDPAMIEVFVSFLRKVCGVTESKLRGFLYCYSNQDIQELTDFWSLLTGIPESQFTKPYVRHDFDPGKKDKMRHGLLHIRYCDKKLLALLLQWIRDYVFIERCTDGRAVNYTAL